MKPILFIVLGFLTSVSLLLGGGNTSVVHLSVVHSVKVEPAKITIIWTGYVELRVMTDGEPATSSVFGQPAQLVRAKTTRGTFEIIPYSSNPEIKGVPTGGHSSDELKKLSAQWWKEMKERYASVRAGDSVTIGYQEDRITISEFQIQGIIGAGTLTVTSKSKTSSQAGAGQPAIRSESKPDAEGRSR